VAQRLLDNARDSDVVGQMGGDEFAVALVQADHETAMAKAQSLAQVIEATPVTLGEGSTPLHVSFGVREIDPDTDPEVVLAEMGAVMFLNKRARTAT
jgi:diguanylate cyclase (GGDEF)-like protein